MCLTMVRHRLEDVGSDSHTSESPQDISVAVCITFYMKQCWAVSYTSCILCFQVYFSGMSFMEEKHTEIARNGKRIARP